MKRLYTLDYLKFILSILIFSHHFQQITEFSNLPIQFYRGKFMFNILVELFFIISGYLCAGNFQVTSETTFEKYFEHKIIRIYPMVIICTIATSIIGLSYHHLYDEWFFDTPINVWNVFNSLLLLFAGGAVKNAIGIVPPLWYLCVLIYCYVLAYFSNWLASRFNIKALYLYFLIFIGGTSCLQFGIELPFYNNLSARGYSSFFLGVLLFSFWNYYSHKKIILFSSLVLFFSCVSLYKFDYFILENQRDVFTYLIFPCILFLTIRLNDFISINLLNKAHLGNVSFEIYIWHYPIIFLILYICRIRNFVLTDNVTTYLIVLLIVVTFSFLVHFFVERPISKLIN